MKHANTASQRTTRAVVMRLKRHRRLVAAVLAALSVAFGLAAVRPPAPAGVRVLTAARDLPGGTELREQDIRPVMMPSAAVPDGALRDRVVGRVLAGPMRRGEIVTDTRLVGDGLLKGYGPGTVAAPIRVADTAALRLLRPGDRIDVFATAFSGGSGIADLNVDDLNPPAPGTGDLSSRPPVGPTSSPDAPGSPSSESKSSGSDASDSDPPTANPSGSPSPGSPSRTAPSFAPSDGSGPALSGPPSTPGSPVPVPLASGQDGSAMRAHPAGGGADGSKPAGALHPAGSPARQVSPVAARRSPGGNRPAGRSDAGGSHPIPVGFPPARLVAAALPVLAVLRDDARTGEEGGLVVVAATREQAAVLAGASGARLSVTIVTS